MSEERNYYLETLARMEQDIAMVDTGAALASIAISLKRIADVAEKLNAEVDLQFLRNSL